MDAEVRQELMFDPSMGERLAEILRGCAPGADAAALFAMFARTLTQPFDLFPGMEPPLVVRSSDPLLAGPALRRVMKVELHGRRSYLLRYAEHRFDGEGFEPPLRDRTARPGFRLLTGCDVLTDSTPLVEAMKEAHVTAVVREVRDDRGAVVLPLEPVPLTPSLDLPEQLPDFSAWLVGLLGEDAELDTEDVVSGLYELSNEIDESGNAPLTIGMLRALHLDRTPEGERIVEAVAAMRRHPAQERLF